MKRYVTVLFALLFCFNAIAQKTVAGVKFSACLNKQIPFNFYKNKFLVLDFWATWCGPCIGSFPKINALQQKYKDSNKIVFASITAEPKEKIEAFFARRKDILPEVMHLVDDSGATWRYYEINIIPAVLVFDTLGKMVFKGTIEELTGSMGKLLKGDVLIADEKPMVKVNDWDRVRRTASFMAITGGAETTDEATVSTRVSGDKVSFGLNRLSLSDAISVFGKLSTVRIKSTDSQKAAQLINLYFKQDTNRYPEYDKGIFLSQYQNHMLGLLEKNYVFHSRWVTEEMPGYKIVIKDKAKLGESITISTKGSFSSRIDQDSRKFSFVNQKLAFFAEYAEDLLGNVFYSDIDTTTGYDLVLEFSSIAAFSESLKKYGLGLERSDHHQVNKLLLTFE